MKDRPLKPLIKVNRKRFLRLNELAVSRRDMD